MRIVRKKEKRSSRGLELEMFLPIKEKCTRKYSVFRSELKLIQMENSMS